VNVTWSFCLTGVAGGLFHVALDVVSAVPVASTDGRLFAKLATGDPDVPIYSSSKLMSSLLSDADEMISTVAVFAAPMAVFSTSNQKLSSGNTDLSARVLDASLR